MAIKSHLNMGRVRLDYASLCLNTNGKKGNELVPDIDSECDVIGGARGLGSE